MKAFLAAFVMLVVSACAALEGESYEQQVFGAKEDYKNTLKVVAIYEERDRCTGLEDQLVDKVLCSDPRVVDNLRSALKTASAALDEAEQIVRDPEATEDKVRLSVELAKSANRVLQTIVNEYDLLEE